MNIWDLLLRPKCTTVTNQVGRSQQLLLLLTVFTFTCSNGSNTRQLFDGCHPPTCPAAGTRELSAPLWMLIYLYRRLAETHDSGEVTQDRQQGEQL